MGRLERVTLENFKSYPGTQASRAGLAEGEGYRARVLCRAEDWDLALLTVDEDAFWSGVEAAPLNAQVTCRPDSFVTVAGFYNKSLTTDEWMVQDYALGPSCLNLNLYRNGHSGWGGRDGPAMPFGCSGGPVFAQTKGLGWSVVGMLSAGQPDRAILHTVPAHLIQKMIRQYEAHGQFVGGSSPSFKFQRLLNPYLRESLGMGVASSGIAPWLEKAGLPLRPGDILMEVDGLAVDDQGVISLPPDRMQVDLRGLWDLKEDGQELTAKVLREGRVVQLKGPTKRVPPVVPISSASVTPPRSYILVGGLLFLPASQAKVVAHQARINQAPVETQLLFKAEPREHPEEEYVLLWRIYPHEINEGYQERLARLLKFNGVPVKNLAHLEELIQGARPEQGDAEWLDFELADAEQRKIVLPAYQAWAAEDGIRKTNRIPYHRPRSRAEDDEKGREGGGQDEEEDDDKLIG
ncbi:trypsin family [Nannochloropsis gaditana CCMP526]|uniref:trypsin family n=1 Tax=Nannochloropsis gaditana (strain CCMP526) TaxID=1093141 RepID=UPI00029F5FE5|nr:trypsin family [Nannochloropsis gaditana CCMP526]EKU21166.1 trypsin family [Nannochloropsis gaditana CCMP526]|eukprot:XP_005855197.1 trypsin family [Nannochloropsis gaditana CCMP526]